MNINVKFEYIEKYLPTPRCRKYRTREVKGICTVTVREAPIGKMVPAFGVEQYIWEETPHIENDVIFFNEGSLWKLSRASRYYAGKSWFDLAPCTPEFLACHLEPNRYEISNFNTDVCACSIFEDESHAGITEKCTKKAGSVKEIEDAILFVSRIYELREGFSRNFVETVNMYPTEYRAIRKALYGEEALGGSTGVIFSNKVLFKDGSVMTITYTGDGKGKAWGEAVLTEKDSEKIIAQSPISYTFANHWKLCFKGAVYHAFIKITQ